MSVYDFDGKVFKVKEGYLVILPGFNPPDCSGEVKGFDLYAVRFGYGDLVFQFGTDDNLDDFIQLALENYDAENIVWNEI